MGLTLPLLTMTLSIDNLLNGLTRPLCGFLSDKIGRENTMFLIFIGEGLALLGMMQFGHNPVRLHVLRCDDLPLLGRDFLDLPGGPARTHLAVKFAAANAGTLYTAKGTAALLVPLASVLSTGGSWDAVFISAAVISIVAGLSAKFVLAPMRRRWIANTAIASDLEASHFRQWPEGSHE